MGSTTNWHPKEIIQGLGKHLFPINVLPRKVCDSLLHSKTTQIDDQEV